MVESLDNSCDTEPFSLTIGSLMVKWFMCQSSESSLSLTSVVLKRVRPAWFDMRTESGTQPKSKVSFRQGRCVIIYFIGYSDVVLGQ